MVTRRDFLKLTGAAAGTAAPKARRPDNEHFTVINRYPAPAWREQPLDVKVQCMHCEKPACVSACIVGALEKNPLGPVTYDAWKCIGCRYCMVACPYQIPAYEYENALTPRVMKCTMCPERTLVGKLPACAEICPREAILFGKREQLLELARERIAQHPERYHPEVYGEHEVGGTSWLLIADRPLTECGIPELSDPSPAVLTETIQHGIFRGFSGPLMIFGLLSVLMKSSTDRRNGAGSDQDQERPTRTGRTSMPSHQQVDGVQRCVPKGRHGQAGPRSVRQSTTNVPHPCSGARRSRSLPRA
ncbi:MAG: 4Fe-4S dicluster domain-containing protein [bacterium]|nr:4Fe-4S dicluster domain-containing protein [bacterium]